MKPTAVTMHLALMSFSLVASASGARAADANLWQDTSESAILNVGARYINTLHSRVLVLDYEGMRNTLAGAPNRDLGSLRLRLPMPDGSFSEFSIFHAPIMAPELAVKFPETRTFAGQGLTNPAETVRLDVTPFGFHAMILSPSGRVFIDPLQVNDTRHYICYYARDYARPADKARGECAVPGADSEVAREIQRIVRSGGAPRITGGTVRSYRLAMACTAEYRTFHGGTDAAAMAAIVTSVNRVTGIYETEVAVTFVLPANNNLLISSNPSDYTNNDCGTMLDENQTRIDNIIGSANYDVGHVMGTGGGGAATIGVPCESWGKARGCTGTPTPVGDPFDVDFVAHEVGHQFGGSHTFTSTTGICTAGSFWASTAYEIASGATILSYCGYCDPQDLEPHPLPIFHAISLDEINTIIADYGGKCASASSNGNNAPTSNAGTGGVTIPKSTPFQLTGSGSDPDGGDMLTYSWEQFDRGARNPDPNDCTYAGPLFRTFLPKTTPVRVLPQLSDILNNTQTLGEVLPCVARRLTFRLTVRDNRAGGGCTAKSEIQINVNRTAGPFRVTNPNTALTWNGNSVHLVEWDVSGTTGAPVNAATVDIMLSLDGGQTFPHVLATGTANDGSETVLVPNTGTSMARIKVSHALNSTVTFLDISDQDFAIVQTTAVAVDGLPQALTLHAARPNPFNQSTTIAFDLPRDSRVNLAIYDVTGRAVRTLTNEKLRAASYQFAWNGLDHKGQSVEAGIYLYKVISGGETVTRKVVLAK